MTKFRQHIDEAEFKVTSDGSVERCIQCGCRLVFKTKDEDRRKCRECMNTMVEAKEIYFER